MNAAYNYGVVHEIHVIVCPNNSFPSLVLGINTQTIPPLFQPLIEVPQGGQVLEDRGC